jgi:antitoxin component YwqK of YwqJK toxin-antitoxin module
MDIETIPFLKMYVFSKKTFMKIVTTLLLVLIFAKMGYNQNFGCYSELAANQDGVFDRQRSSSNLNIDSIFWATYNVQFTNDGYYKSMWNKYQVKMEGNVINAMKQGQWRLYLGTENAFYELNYVDNKKNGVCKKYLIFRNDTILNMKGNYKNDLRNGKFVYYNGNDTVVSLIENYKDGKLNGFYKKYYSFPKQKKYLGLICNYKNGKKNGIEKTYKLDKDENVYLFRKAEYVEGKQIGKEIDFSSTGDTIQIRDCSSKERYGVLEYEKQYYKGKYLISYKEKNGIIESYDFSKYGDTTFIKIYDKIKGVGVTKYYALDSINKCWIIDREIFYYNHKSDFRYKKYHVNGQLAYEILFKDKLLHTAIKAYSIDGKKLDVGTLKNGNGTLNCYYSNGTLKSAYSYKNSICIGKIFNYYQNGNIRTKGEMFNVMPKEFSFSKYSNEGEDLNLYYLDRNLFGEIYTFNIDNSKRSEIVYDTTNSIRSFKYYYDNGFISSVFSTFENQYTGLYTSFYENGNIKMEGNYIINANGYSEKDSIWNYYYEEGNIRASICYKLGKKVNKSKYYDQVGTLKRVEIIKNNGVVYNLFDGDTVNYQDENGLKQGKWIYFSPSYSFSDNDCSDIPNEIEYYKDDKPVGIWIDDRSGLKRIYAWKDTAIAYVYVYNKNDILLSEGESVGEYHKFGIWKEYHPVKGYLLEKGEYSFGFRIGIWETYKKNGKLKKVIDYNK